MFNVPSISQIERDEESGPSVTPMFNKRRKVAGDSSASHTSDSVSADQPTGGGGVVTDEGESKKKVVTVDYKQIIQSAPGVSDSMKKALNAAASEGRKDLFKLGEIPESKPAPVVPVIVPQRNYGGSTIFAFHKQKGNPILKYVRNVSVEFVNDISPDFILSEKTCALFLSLRYHALNPNYIYDRIRGVGSAFKLRLLIVQVDQVDTRQSVMEINKACFHADFTLMLAFSAEEAGRYLEAYKVYQFKPADVLKADVESHPTSRAIDFLTTIKSVNKTDAETLLVQFDTIANICQASEEQLKQCPGLGATKAAKIYTALHQGFLRKYATKGGPAPKPPTHDQPPSGSVSDEEALFDD